MHTEEEKQFFRETIAGVMADHLAALDPADHRRQHDFLAVLMERESRRAARDQAIIEKTLAGLVWAAVVGLGLAIWEYLRNHLR